MSVLEDIVISRYPAENGEPSFSVHHNDGTTIVSGYVPITPDDARYWLEEGGISGTEQSCIITAMTALGIFGS